MERVWTPYLTGDDKLVIEKGGYGKSRGLGTRPMLVVIDAQYNYVGEDRPVGEQLAEWPSGGGAAAWAAIRRIQPLLKQAREAGIPVLLTRNVQKNLAFDSFGAKSQRDQSRYVEGHRGTFIVDELAPQPGDLTLDKAYASIFYGTPLLSWLVKMKIDTLILTGGSTSGCVRASAVDAVTRNFNVAVVEDCVYDRISISHAAGLLDMWMKYCDVMNSEEISAYMKGLGGGHA
ncbi:isochorismatase family protein [Mailhella massiliensis]|uniref:Isochorismatase family protein n=1 Tax=Mailhella massiliensis TaxID=1903261 RepID=A0A921AY53_9BACT|nr:isochorismatase family protein [Mailhella massiliensis]HJD97933.1 isochorismatase family protein [Mailhella massiliensis]